MTSIDCPTVTAVTFPHAELQVLIDLLWARGYRVVGPRVTDGAVVYDELTALSQLPRGLRDEQSGGRYRLHASPEAGYFDHVVGPHSLKQFLFPPHETIQTLSRREGNWQVKDGQAPASALAVLGARSCDLQAVAIQDRVFLHGPYVDPGYQARRERLLLIAVQCRQAAATCFCHAQGTGPRATQGFDLALTELSDRFVLEVGSPRGQELAAALAVGQPTSPEDWAAAVEQSAQLEESLRRGHRQLPAEGLHDLLLNHLNHPHWQSVAERCLSCANCTLVCPTCFCSTIHEVSDLTGEEVRRERSWTSCFAAEHSFVSSGVVRASTASRYRQWLTHKLATWIDQFGVSGCVGCGRCITWCPVGIDLTQEVAALREATQ